MKKVLRLSQCCPFFQAMVLMVKVKQLYFCLQSNILLPFGNDFVQNGRKLNLEVENNYHDMAMSHCYQVNDCSSKILVIKNGGHFLRHC